MNFKIFKVMKSTSTTIFSQYLLSNTLMISFEDLIMIFYIWIYKTTIESVMKQNPILIALLNTNCRARYGVTNTKC